MRRTALLAARAGVLAGPFALAFASGGYFTGARLVAGVVAWALLALAVVAADAPLHPSPATLCALGGLAALALWTALSGTWAPLGAGAADAAERALLYLGALGAAYAALTTRAAARAVEPAVAAGCLVVAGYGLAGRLLPDLVELTRTRSSGGRLDQPLTYWNATGALAAIGFVACARLAGDRTRPLALRVAAAASSAPLGLAIYLTFSRGALTALGAGLAVLLLLAPSWAQARAGAIALEAGVLAAGIASLLPAVEDAEGDGFAAQGAAMLAALLAIAAAAGALQWWSARAEEDGTTRLGPLPRSPALRRAAAVAAALFAIAPFGAAVLDHGSERPADPAFGATAGRLASVGSKRYEYWEAALKTFADDPAVGAGAGAFTATWLRHREIAERVNDAHSLELETAAELGLAGLILLGLVLGGVAVAARSAYRSDPGLAAGPAAALVVWAAHSAIDWDWEMPALTLVAVVLAGTLLAAADRAAQLR